MRRTTLVTMAALVALSAACGSDPANDGAAGSGGSAGAGSGGSSGSGGSATPGPGARVLSISMTPAHLPTSTAQDFADARKLAKDAGARGNFLSYTWSSLEPMAGAMDVSKVETDVTSNLANGFSTLYVSIQMINTTAKETPSDLKAVPFDDASMKARFHALVDAIAPSLAGKIRWFGIGNEVDVYLAATKQWSAFQSFFEDGAAYVRSKIPGAQVGTTLTFGGAVAHPSERDALTANADVLVFTDYPLGASFAPLPPSHGADDLDAMVAMAKGKPVVIQELGYPADAAVLGSSEDAQAAFFSNAISEWSTIGGDALPFVNVFLEHDFSTSMCEQLAQYYGATGDARFEAYLCSIGLRRNDGTPKKAWDALVNTAASTGLP